MNKNVVPEPATKNGSGNILETIFTGGAFEDDFSKEEILSSATVIASKIKSTKDLGWKIDPPKRKGKARPRHRAWGGEGEMPVQDKANYKEENERCVEKWLTWKTFWRILNQSLVQLPILSLLHLLEVPNMPNVIFV